MVARRLLLAAVLALSSVTVFAQSMSEAQKTQIAFKKVIGFDPRSRFNEFYSEPAGGGINMSIDAVWASTVSSTPATCVSAGACTESTLFPLTQDLTVANKKGWCAASSGDCVTGTRIRNWVPPRFGTAYTVSLFDQSNVQIFTTDAITWYFDYEDGYLTLDCTGSCVTPTGFKITAWRYVGKTVASSDWVTADMIQSSGQVDGDVLTWHTGDVLSWDVAAGGGAPTTADYLVGTANAGLSAEIVVGTAPGGELGGTWASPTIDDSLAVTGWTLTTPTVTCTDCITDANVTDITLNSGTAGSYVQSVATTAPLSGGAGGSEGATLTLAIANALADGATEGAASFTAADFNDSAANISIDYTNAQTASGSVKGFLTSADWTTFNNKGTVTSVAVSVPSEWSVSGSPITTSGTFTISEATQTANTVYAGPTSGGVVAPGFRALVDNDVPDGITVSLAATATALATNGGNCSAGSFPLGVDASGAVESCASVVTTVNWTVYSQAGEPAVPSGPGYWEKTGSNPTQLHEAWTNSGGTRVWLRTR